MISDAIVFFSSFAWVLSGIAKAFVILILARLFLYSWQQHGYLYQGFSEISQAGGLTKWSHQLIQTWVGAMVPVVSKLPLVRYRRRLVKLLSQSGTRLDWSPNHFISLQCVLVVVMGLISFFLLFMMLGIGIFWVVVLASIAALSPYFRLVNTATTRLKASHRELPFVVDYLALAMSAGADFNYAVKVVVQHVPDSPLKGEFKLMLQNMRFGLSRQESLEELQRRLDTPPIRLFCQTLSQSLALGTHVGESLSRMSSTLQQKRFQVAEEEAGKISVKIMIPTMIFIMPAVLIVLLGPMVLAYFTAG